MLTKQRVKDYFFAGGRLNLFSVLQTLILILTVGVFIMTANQCAKAAEPIDRVDVIKAYPPHEYCYSIGGLFAAGIVSRNNGKLRAFKQIGESEPVNAIALVGFNSYTAKEKAFVAEHLFAGWDYADEKFKEGPKPIGVNVEDSNRYTADCLLIEQHRQYNKGER